MKREKNFAEFRIRRKIVGGMVFSLKKIFFFFLFQLEAKDVFPDRQFFWRYVFSLQVDPSIKSVKTYRSYISMAKKWLAAFKGWEVDHQETKKRIKAVGKRLPQQSMFLFVLLKICECCCLFKRRNSLFVLVSRCTVV